MYTRGLNTAACAIASLALLLLSLVNSAAGADQARIEAALENITNLTRPGQDGYATIWDGNKYVQCKRLQDRNLRCEAAGTLMQPSLRRVLTPERAARLEALGWQLDSSFGNYLQIFPADAASRMVADTILQTLRDGYEANIAELQVQTAWVPRDPCPPRNGPSQNLAGTVNNSAEMALTAIYGCAYKADLAPNGPADSAAELVRFFGARVTAEVQRLRVNTQRNVFAAFAAGIGYVQCRPDLSAPIMYCEAQSAESWEALTSVLTPERIRRLHELGFADPGRAPNYWKIYPLDRFDDAAIAREVLTVLHEVYGYKGRPTLKVKTEEDY
jgi:hypothetical protein